MLKKNKINNKYNYKSYGYDGIRKFKLISIHYKKNENKNIPIDLKNQQNISKLNRWGVELGRGGFDWFWLKLSKYNKNINLREMVEKKRFNRSWFANKNNILRKYLKYLTINQYTLKLIRSKYFGTQLTSPKLINGLGNNLENLKKIMVSSYYPIGQIGDVKKIDISNKKFNN